MEESISVIKIYDKKNPHRNLYSGHLRRFSLNVCVCVCVCLLVAGIAGQRLLRPYFLPPLLTGVYDHDFLRIILSDLSQDVEVKTN